MSAIDIGTVAYNGTGGRYDDFHRAVQALAAAVAAKDHYTLQHSANVAGYAVAIARDMGVGPRRIEEIHVASLLHDIGKIGVSEGILNKRSQLSREEFEVMKAHPAYGIRILAALGFPRPVLTAIYQHHERYDGKGYPQGLAGEEISLMARIITVADAIDAMLSDRPYCSALTIREVLDELERESGRQFDPRVADSARWLLRNGLRDLGMYRDHRQASASRYDKRPSFSAEKGMSRSTSSIRRRSMMRTFGLLTTAILMAVFLSACGGGAAAPPRGGYNSNIQDNNGGNGSSAAQQDGSQPISDVYASEAANVALHARVTLNGGAFFTGGWGNGKVVDASTVVDGVFLPRSSQWDQGPVWWDSSDGVDRSITIELGGVFSIESLAVQADDNDAYHLYYRDAAAGTWKIVWNVPNYDAYPDSSSWGMQTRPDTFNNAAQYALPQPIITDALMIKGDMNSGDRLFAVSEVQAFGISTASASGTNANDGLSPSGGSNGAGGVSDTASPSGESNGAGAASDNMSSSDGTGGTGAGLSGYGTATIDGGMSMGEWDKAARIDFQANIPSNDGGGTTPATLYVMNDKTNLYLAVRIARTSFGGATNPVFEFDNDNDGVREPGDDGYGMYVGIYSSATFLDAYRYTCPGSPAGSAGCSALDTETTRGILPAGANNGAAAAKNDGAYTIIEMSHPFNSGDRLHDFSLKYGDTVGFSLNLRLFSLTPACNFGPACYADTEFPGAGTGPYGHISIAASAASLNAHIGIDIKPGGAPNSINPGDEGTVPVAILSRGNFNAPATVDAATLTFGRTGDETSLAFCNAGGEDVNTDGLLDLVCHFNTRLTGFLPGDAKGHLKGKTREGASFSGTDSVRIVQE